MLRRTLTVLPPILLYSVLTLLLNLTFVPITYAFSYTAPKPTLTLNRLQGPLGVTLTLKGQNFTPGQASLSYIDSQNVPGAFVNPGDSSVQVQHDGTLITTNLIMPANGPAGTWKIVVTDSSRIPWSVPYLVLAAPGQPIADTPSLALDPTTRTGGGIITFTGNNWLPAGTAVQLTLLLSTTSMPLLTSPSISDTNGMIAGTFRLPANLNQPQVTVSATDIATNTLRAQVPILITAPSPTPSASPTPPSSPTATSVPTPVPTTAPTPGGTASPISSAPGGINNSGGPLPPLDPTIWGPVLLIVGGALGMAAVMLILFLIPWGERRVEEYPRRRRYF